MKKNHYAGRELFDLAIESSILWEPLMLNPDYVGGKSWSVYVIPKIYCAYYV